MPTSSAETPTDLNNQSMNDRGLQGQQLASKHHPSTQVGHRAALQLGDSPQHSLKSDLIIENVIKVAAAKPKDAAAPSATAPGPEAAAAAAEVSPLVAASTPMVTSAQQPESILLAAAAANAEGAHTSSHDSAGTGHQQKHKASVPASPKQQYGQGFVPRKDTTDQVPCFVQTSALFTNMCGYCGTRSTSGCWRRGWEVGPNKFVNLCNKCGLRHKAGKLPSVPEPPPPQLRVRAAAAAAAATSSGGHGHYDSLQHSQGSPNFSTGHGQDPASSDPTAAAAAGQRGTSSSGGRRRRQQKPLTPKWSRVGAAVNEFQQDAHMFAHMLAQGAFDNSGASMDMYAGMMGMMTAEQQQQQQQLAALLESLAEGAASPATGSVFAPSPDPHSSGHHSRSHASDAPGGSGSFAHYAAAGQHSGLASGVPSPASAGGAPQAASMDSAQAVAAVLAAAAVAASSDSKGTMPLPPPLKLSKLSVVSGVSAPDNSQLSSPAAKKQRTKKDGPGEDAQRAEDAAAAGDAADALLALRSSAKPESPSWARMQQQLVPPSSMSPMRVSPAMNALQAVTMPGMNMNMMGGRQVTSPSVATTSAGVGANTTSPLAHYFQPQQMPIHPGAHPQMPQAQASRYPQYPHHPGSHLQPLEQPQFNLAWSQEQLQAWLQHVGCGEAAAAFQAAGIDGPALSGLMRTTVDSAAARLDDRLKVDLKVEPVALRLKVVDKMMAELAYRGH